jgi:hypothetical protein
MTDTRDIVVQRLMELEIEYWHDVDFNWGRNANAWYMEDGTFAIGDHKMEGRSAIEEFYRWREQRGQRTARHLVTNFRLSRLEANSASIQCILLLYAADGNPVLRSNAPIMIADIDNECVLCPDGQWRFQSHRLTPIFMGDELPTIPVKGTI